MNELTKGPNEEKFLAEDLPIIHAAVDRARRAKAPAKVTIEVASSGGIIGVNLEIKEKLK